MNELEAVLTNIEQEVFPWTERIIELNKVAGTAALSRLDEAAHKLAVQMEDASQLLGRCNELHKDTDDRWPSTDLSPMRARLNALQKHCRRKIVEFAPEVPTALSDDAPDGFGWAYLNSVDAVLDMITELDENGLNHCSLYLAKASAKAWNRLAMRVGPNDLIVRAHFVSEPLVTLAQLSGIALVVARLRRRSGIYAPFSASWDKLVEADPQWANRLVLGLQADEDLLAISSHKIARIRRERIVADRLKIGHRNLLSNFEDRESTDDWNGSVIDHLGFWSYQDLFFVEYFLSRRSNLVNVSLVPERLLDIRQRLAVYDEE
jgi:hypothetical protein